MDIKKYLQEKKALVDSALEKYFPNREASDEEKAFPASLYHAMRYSLLAGGKRIRPILAMAAYEAVDGSGEEILPFVCALEMIHTYSLIHDDLPALDNDDYRRGKPTCHKVFGEAMGILAGDALLTEAFCLMANQVTQEPFVRHGKLVLEVIQEVAQASGWRGMVGGQVLDIESEGKETDLHRLQSIHARKTGALMLVSIRVGAKLGRANGKTLQALTHYGEKIGLAFQIADDILNVEGKSLLLGKQTGSDAWRKKATYPALLGLEESKKKAKELVDLAEKDIQSLGEKAQPLREIARFILSRES